MNMMNLLSNMGLRGTKGNIWLKPINGIEFYFPPAKDGGNLLNRNVALAHSIEMNRNAAIAHSKIDKQTISLGMGFNPSNNNNNCNWL